MVDFSKIRTSKKDSGVISSIVARADRMFPWVDKTCLTMDMMAVHSKHKIRLKELLDSGDEDFRHDIVGIDHHIDRETGKLTDCFLPRSAY